MPFTGRADSIALCRVVTVSTVPLICLLSFVVSTSSFSSVCQEKHEQSECHRAPEISDRKRRVGFAVSLGAFNRADVDRTSHCRGGDTVASSVSTSSHAGYLR